MGRWACGICGGEVVEGQRFTFIGGIGAVHVECLYKRVLPTASDNAGDLAALLDANEVLLYAIVRSKEAEGMASSDDVRSSIAEVRKEVEKLAGRLSTILGRRAGLVG